MAGFKSERWPDIDRNAGRLHVGIRNKPRGLRRMDTRMDTMDTVFAGNLKEGFTGRLRTSVGGGGMNHAELNGLMPVKEV